MGGQEADDLERTDAGLVEVKPKPKRGLTSKAIDWLEWAFVKMMHDPKQPLHYLAGNFGPVDETPPLTDLPVQGHLPVSSSIFPSELFPNFMVCLLKWLFLTTKILIQSIYMFANERWFNLPVASRRPCFLCFLIFIFSPYQNMTCFRLFHNIKISHLSPSPLIFHFPTPSLRF